MTAPTLDKPTPVSSVEAQALTQQALADAFARKLKRKLGQDGLSEAETAFIAQVHEDCAVDEISGLSPEDLAYLALGFWDFAETRPDRAPKIRLFSAKGADARDLDRCVLEIVQDDAPFLVDTVMGEIAEGGYAVRAMFHPVVEVGRDAKGRRTDDAGEPRRESMIQVLLDPLGEQRAKALMQGVLASVADVRMAVADWAAMRDLMAKTVEDLRATAPKALGKQIEEDSAFLNWLADDHFVFLGARIYEYPRNAKGEYEAEEPRYTPKGSYGVLRDQARAVLRRDSEPAILSPASRRYIADSELVVAKSNLRSRVHRRTYMDYVGVKTYGPDGQAAGEVRFVGLFTAEAYEAPVRDVPVVRRKILNVIVRAQKTPGGHNEKRLRNILDTYPRDELFQMSEDELLRIALGIVHLYDRPRIRLFARHDPFDRFISVLLFVPRERYDSEFGKVAGEILAKAFGGRVSAAYPSFTDQPLARIHYIIGVRPGAHGEPDILELEAEIAEASRTWFDRFSEALVATGIGHDAAADLASRYVNAFPPGYRDIYGSGEALADIAVMEGESAEPIRVRAYRAAGDSKLQFRFKLYREGEEPAPLSDVLPILEHMGLKALIEEGLPVEPIMPDGKVRKIWIHDFLLEDERGEKLVFADIKECFEQAFLAVWTGRTESDGFNRLVMELGVSWREAALVRALARYRQQSGVDPSQAVQTLALRDFPDISRLILKMFQARFDPASGASIEAREAEAEALHGEINAALQQVASLDADRVLRRLALLVRATKRTNYYQTGPDGGPKPYISYKIASRELDDLPAPKPFREIFVWAPHVEGVHLRFGPVARGGLRWSDRRDDFRTEVLGLVKAQQVKNAVIVPVGSKGGFYPKQLPRGGAADAVRAEGVRAYTTFLSGLLDITDNLDAKGKVVHPADTVIHDADDPYLVVAADKGTATFSDIANGVAEDYGFWLGDAFASGGSQGYDHKVMGITARGAWEAVKRHFREMGKDIQKEPFTVIGVGDMSGDVFGNGMLLSKAIQLVAAFDHRDIFIDPTPDPASSWKERQRLFGLPRSSWQDYDKARISKGGGVFPRSAKSIALTPEIKALLDITVDALSPDDLIRAVLRARAELLYLGGIGTYVRAPNETDAEVGDKANDAIRATAGDLRVQVIGEGANLGVTQAGRIAFARAGGRVNTDAIDNSAGVDTSDHEVNIKILTGALEASGKMTRDERNVLLASMTDEVADHVLQHNYDQTLALSLQEANAADELSAQARFMDELVAAGRLDRKVEGLPGPAQVAELAAAGKGLTRPELAVLLAYGKLELKHDIVASAAPDDPYFLKTLEAYFPTKLADFDDAMKRHRLRREIIATVLANDMVNKVGPTFPNRLRAAAGCDAVALITAYEAAKRVFRLDEAWTAVETLDLKIPAQTQLALFQELALLLRRQTFWLARRANRQGATVESLVKAYQPIADALRAEGMSILSPFEGGDVEARAKAFIGAGAPKELARTIASLRPLMAGSDIADVAKQAKWDVMAAARVYHAVGAVFGFDRLRAAAGSLASRDPFERMAVRRLIEEMLSEQAGLARAVIAAGKAKDAPSDFTAAAAMVETWAAGHKERAEAARSALAEIEAAAGGWSFAKLTIVNSALGGLAAEAKAAA
jgi:glutamate dehydrogenase